MKLDLSYYMSIFWRRFPYFALIASLFTAIGLTVALVLPPQYRATATLLMESPQIPDELAASTVQTVVREQLQIIEQRLMTRSNLIDTAARLNVFVDQNDMSASQIVEAMRARTKFRTETGRAQATFVRVTFEAEDPVLAARVTNEFVTLILDENVRMRTGVAGETLEFFEDEVDRLTAELDAQSAEILKFKSENARALPENRDFLVARQSGILDQLRKFDRQVEDLGKQKVAAQELFDATGAVEAQQQVSPEQAAYLDAKRKYDEALLVFSPTNPRIKVLSARLAQAEARLQASLPPGEGEGQEQDRARAVLNAQLAELDRRIAEMSEFSEGLKEELVQVEAAIGEIPANTVVIESLQRAYSNTQAEFRQASSRLSRAATGERIELLSKGQRIIVIEQATVPERPASPNRKMIALTGLGAGVGLGFGLILMLELLNRSVRRPVEITDKLGISPFAVLPFIRTEQEVRWRRMIILATLATFVIGVPILLWLFHSYVVPLDSFAERILNRFGLTLALQ